MQKYLLTRFAQSCVVLIVVSIVIFLLSRITGSPLDVIMPVEASKEDYQRMSVVLGLDQPLPVQYLVFLNNAVHGDLGTSIRGRKPVGDLIMQRLPNSAALAAFSMVVACIIAFPLGVLAAVRKGGKADAMATGFAVLGQSMPTFWLGIMLIIVLAVQVRLFPPFGAGGFMNFVLPGVTLGWAVSAGLTRLIRGAMLEALDSEYVKLARLNGVPERQIIWKHALRNSLIAPLTFAGFYFATLIGSAVVVETVFAWPGLGRLAYDAVVTRDYPVMQGVVLTIAAIVVAVNLVVDVAYAYIDPRIKY